MRLGLSLGFRLVDGFSLGPPDGNELGSSLGPMDGEELRLGSLEEVRLGLPDGCGLGLRLGVSEGLELGSSLGPMDGEELRLGSLEGVRLGPPDGCELGLRLGLSEGFELATSLGPMDGEELGLRLGVSDGLELGSSLGSTDGEELRLGRPEGLSVGTFVVGVFVGVIVGEFVVTVTDMVTFKVAAPAVVSSLLNDESSVSLESTVALLASFLRARAKLPSTIELANLLFTTSSN